jgi:hypothetical protein
VSFSYQSKDVDVSQLRGEDFKIKREYLIGKKKIFFNKFNSKFHLKRCFTFRNLGSNGKTG